MTRQSRTEEWADVPGYEGRYQASTFGNVRRRSDTGRYFLLKPFRREKQISCQMYRIRMSAPDGKRKEVSLLSVIAATWKPPPPGMVVIHRNGMFTDNSVDNIRFVTRQELITVYAHRHHRKVVCKVDENGEPMEYYPSITEAARQNYISAGAVSKQCLRKVENPLTTGSVIFRFEK